MAARLLFFFPLFITSIHPFINTFAKRSPTNSEAFAKCYGSVMAISGSSIGENLWFKHRGMNVKQNSPAAMGTCLTLRHWREVWCPWSGKSLEWWTLLTNSEMSENKSQNFLVSFMSSVTAIKDSFGIPDLAFSVKRSIRSSWIDFWCPDAKDGREWFTTKQHWISTLWNYPKGKRDQKLHSIIIEIQLVLMCDTEGIIFSLSMAATS